eukprot:gene7916-8733_t
MSSCKTCPASSCGACAALCKAFKNPLVVSSAVTASYVLLYTGYDKVKQTIDPSLLLDFFLVRKGWNWTLKELNKVLSLSGLTCMLLSFLPCQGAIKKDLLGISLVTLWTHGAFSMYSFYKFNPLKVLKDRVVKRISVLLGAATSVVLTLGYRGTIPPCAVVASATTLALGHFYTMEVDNDYRLQVRPAALLPFPLAGWVLYRYYIAKSTCCGPK